MVTRTSAPALLVALMALLSLSACSGEPTASSTGHRVDLEQMTYRGTGLGATIAEIRASFGEPESMEQVAAPAGADRMRGPMSIPLPDALQTDPPLQEPPPLLRYRDAAFLTDGSRVFAVLVEDPHAVTEKGVSVGDELERADTVYRLRCTTALGWSDEDVYAACFGRLSAGRYVWFGGDPIENISFATVPLTSSGGYGSD
jgi:hypothetical protein